MANTLKLGAGKWATGTDTVLAFNDENNNFKPLPFDFSRASSATVVNQSGLIETVGSGTPRIDFLGNTKGALLLEPQRTNLLVQSNQFDTTWLNSSTNVTSGYLGLDGTNSAWLLTKAASSFSNIRQNITFSGIHTFSVYLKKGTNTSAVIRSTGGNDARVEINLIDGTTSGEVNTTSVKTESMGNDWWRCSMTLDASSNTAVRIYPEAPLGGATAGSIYMQYAQLEVGSYATSYIFTSGSAVTRVGEVCNQTVPSAVPTSGVIYAEIELFNSVLDTSSSAIRYGINQTIYSGNWIFFGIEDGNDLRVYIRANDSTSFDSYSNNVFATAGVYKIAMRFAPNDTKVFVNGVQRASSENTVIASNLNNLNISGGGTASSPVNNSVKNRDFRLYNTALTDQELIALTTI